jgi:hypothetical protein
VPSRTDVVQVPAVSTVTSLVFLPAASYVTVERLPSGSTETICATTPVLKVVVTVPPTADWTTRDSNVAVAGS